jgi:hypothetical protein
MLQVDDSPEQEPNIFRGRFESLGELRDYAPLVIELEDVGQLPDHAGTVRLQAADRGMTDDAIDVGATYRDYVARLIADLAGPAARR